MPSRPVTSSAARSVLAALALAFTGATLAPPAAHAGAYTAWLCATPSGAKTTIDGWTHSEEIAGHIAAKNECGGTGSLNVNFNGNGILGGNREVRWQYAAPATTTITAASLRRGWGVSSNNKENDSYGQSGIMLYGPSSVIESQLSASLYQDPFYAQNPAPDIAFPVNGTAFSFAAGCYGSGQCGDSPLGRAAYGVLSAKIDLVDPVAPAISGVDGTIFAAGARSKQESLTFQASDQGSGVWQAEVKLGNAVVYPRQTLSANGGQCAEVNVQPNVSLEYGSGSPCPAAVAPKIAIDTTKVPNGDHQLVATVWDASGNAVEVVKRTISVANAAPPGAPNGTGGDPATGTIVSGPAPKKPTRFGNPLGLLGQVVDAAGKPIVGGAVDVYERVSIPGASDVKVATITTDGNGNFSHAAGTRSSRAVTFAYAPTVDSTAYVSRFTANVLVRLRVQFKLPSKAKARRTVKFRGVMQVDPLPSRGARVVIESKVGRKWVTAAVVRSRAGGAFTWSHAFRTRGSYRFRARVLGSGDLAAKVGQSAERKLRVR